jgi:hypothetical protein
MPDAGANMRLMLAISAIVMLLIIDYSWYKKQHNGEVARMAQQAIEKLR